MELYGDVLPRRNSVQKPLNPKVRLIAQNGLASHVRERSAANPPEVPEFPDIKDALKPPSPQANLNGKEHPDKIKARRFVYAVCHAMQQLVIYLLGSVELVDPVQMKVLEVLLLRVRCIELRLKASAVVNEPTIDVANTVRGNSNKLLEQQRLLPIHLINISDGTTPTKYST